MANSIYRHNRASFYLSWLIVAVCVSSVSSFARNDLTVSPRQGLATPLNEAPQTETKKTVPVKDLVELYKKHYPNTKFNHVRSPLDYIFKNLGVGQGFLISNSSYYKLRFRYACEKLLSGGMAPSFENYFGSSFGRPNQVPDGHVDVYTAEVIRDLIESHSYDKKPIIIKAAQAAIKDMGAQLVRGSKDIVFAMPFDIALYERGLWDNERSRVTIDESYQIAARINTILNSLPEKQRKAYSKSPLFLLPFDISSGRGIASFNIIFLNTRGEIVADFSQGRVEGMDNIAQVIVDSLFPGIRISNLKRAYFNDQEVDDIPDEILQEIKGSSDETPRYDVPLYEALPNGRTRKTIYVIKLLQTSTTELSLNYFVKGTNGRDEKTCRVLEISVNGDEVQYKCEDITLVRRFYEGGPDDLELRKN